MKAPEPLVLPTHPHALCYTDPMEHGRSNLAVVTCYFNPAGYRRPLANLLRFIREVSPVAPLYVIELALDSQPLVLPWTPYIVRLRSPSVLFHKEALLNILVRYLPPRFTKIAWVDCDVSFGNPGWVKATSDMLDQKHFGQLFESAFRQDRDGVPVEEYQSAGYRWATCSDERFNRSHPGFAWAARRSFWTAGPGLWDMSLWGSGDVFTLAGLMGQWEHPFLGDKNKSQHDEKWRAWGIKAFQWGQKQFGVVPGSIFHHWHGEMKDRQYKERRLSMPEFEVNSFSRDPAGLWSIEPGPLADWFREYFARRNEDGLT